MTDRELLEAAAKAAGIRIEGPAELVADPGHYGGGFSVFNDRGGSQLWNPLTDDGDALRLAVKLNLSFERDFDRVDVYRARDLLATEFLYEKPAPTDIYAATRRAIVRAAAALSPTPSDSSHA